MDVGLSWYQAFPSPHPSFKLETGNFLLHTDGGTRAMKCSASAWYLEARVVHDRVEIVFPIAMIGTYFAANIILHS